MNWRSTTTASSRMSSLAHHNSINSMMTKRYRCLRGKGSMSMRDSLQMRKRRSRVLKLGLSVGRLFVSLAVELG